MNIVWLLKQVNTYTAGYRWLVLFLCGSHIIEALFESGMRISFKFIIDAAIVPQNYNLLVLILLLLCSGAIVFVVVGLLGDFFSAKLGILLLNNIRFSLFERIQNLSMEFFGRRSAGDIINCFQADAEKVENSLVLGLPVVVFCLSNILFSGIFLFSLNWQLAVLSCIGLTFCAITPLNIARRATKQGYHLRQKEGHIASVIEENLLSQSVVKIFGLEKQVSQDFSVHLNDLKQVYVRAKFLSSLVQRIPSLAFVLVQLVILSLSAVMTYWNWISVGTLVSYQVLLLGLHSTILNFTWGLPYLIDGVTGLQRINDILAETTQVQEPPDAIDLPRFQSDICFDNVTFSYSQNRGGVKNLSLKIRQGEYAIFVGESGAGKSTIVNLLTRFYDPDKGRILLDGVDLRDCTIRSLRSQIGLVSQEVILFKGSVRENIRMGYLEASDEEVEAAAKAAEIHNFILSLPQGYDTPVGDRGGQLSGGQRQRIALARALVRNPAILILDEATSALDPATEVEIMTTLERIAQKCTVIVITHKMAHALRADVMFVMDQGCLVVSG